MYLHPLRFSENTGPPFSTHLASPSSVWNMGSGRETHALAVTDSWESTDGGVGDSWCGQAGSGGTRCAKDLLQQPGNSLRRLEFQASLEVVSSVPRRVPLFGPVSLAQKTRGKGNSSQPVERLCDLCARHPLTLRRSSPTWKEHAAPAPRAMLSVVPSEPRGPERHRTRLVARRIPADSDSRSGAHLRLSRLSKHHRGDKASIIRPQAHAVVPIRCASNINCNQSCCSSQHRSVAASHGAPLDHDNRALRVGRAREKMPTMQCRISKTSGLCLLMECTNTPVGC